MIIELFRWITQPSNETLSLGTNPDFFYEYEHSDQLVLQGPYFEYSDNGGLAYSSLPVSEYSATIFSSQLAGKTSVSGRFRLNVPPQGFNSSRRYRIRSISGSSTFTSNEVFTVCAVTECSQYWPVGYDGPQMSADCGLAAEPGYTYSYNCNLCECIKSPAPTATPTSTTKPPATAQYTVQPSSITTTAGSNVSFTFTLSIANSVYNSPSTLWQYSINSVDWIDVVGDSGISSTNPGTVNGYLNLNSVNASLNGRYYRVRCSDPRDGYNVTSNVVNLFVS
jgi:hypothetical protein